VSSNEVKDRGLKSIGIDITSAVLLLELVNNAIVWM